MGPRREPAKRTDNGRENKLCVFQEVRAAFMATGIPTDVCTKEKDFEFLIALEPGPILFFLRGRP